MRNVADQYEEGRSLPFMMRFMEVPEPSETLDCADGTYDYTTESGGSNRNDDGWTKVD